MDLKEYAIETQVFNTLTLPFTLYPLDWAK